jgi:hypothetical protein
LIETAAAVEIDVVALPFNPDDPAWSPRCHWHPSNGSCPKKPRLTNEKILLKFRQIATRAPCYGHVKTLVYIDRDGVITLDADIQPWHTHAVARAIATRGKSFHEGITDHMITNYIHGLEGRISKNQTGVRR